MENGGTGAAEQVSPVELAKAHYQQIERLNPILNAFVDLRHDAALAEARALEARIAHGDDFGPLAGVPISIKSCIDVAGMKCEAGSNFAPEISPKLTPFSSRA